MRRPGDYANASDEQTESRRAVLHVARRFPGIVMTVRAQSNLLPSCCCMRQMCSAVHSRRHGGGGVCGALCQGMPVSHSPHKGQDGTRKGTQQRRQVPVQPPRAPLGLSRRAGAVFP